MASRRASRPAAAWWRRHPVLTAILAVLVLAAAGLGLLLLSLPDVRGLERGFPERTAYMHLRIQEAEKRNEPLPVAHRPVPLSRIPAELQRAVLVAEDAGFYGHRGFDWHEIRASLEKAWRERRFPRGASTITQQLARNLYLSPRRTPLRKVREALIARKLERALGKRRILELYLNVMELGPGTFGVEAASRRYFGVGVSELTAWQAARLAAAIPAPLRHNPATDTRQFRWRADLVYRRAFGPLEEREEVVPPPPWEIQVEEPGLPAPEPGLPAPEPVPRDTVPGDTLSREAAATAGPGRAEP